MNPASTAAGEQPAITYRPATAKSGGIKATWHLKIVTGKDSETLLEMQNKAIIDLLTWAVGHVKTAGHSHGDDRKIGVGNSRGTLELAA